MAENAPTLITHQRLKHIVIENIDMCFDRFRDSFMTILSRFNIFADSNNEMPVQTIVTARSWHPVLKLFLRCPSNPLLCIGAYIEASVYGNTKISMSLVSKQDKMRKVLCKYILY